jgi:hypothetical protein
MYWPLRDGRLPGTSATITERYDTNSGRTVPTRDGRSAMSPANVPAPRGLTQFVAHIVTSLGHHTGMWRVRSSTRPLPGDSSHLVW